MASVTPASFKNTSHCHMKLLPFRRVLCTPCNHTPCHFMQSHIRKVYACLAVTCHLHFWQNDQGILRATAVNIKITSRTCRFETGIYLQLPNFKLRLISWERVTYSILFHKVIKVLFPLSLSHALTYARTHAHTEAQNRYTVCLSTEIGSQANCEISSTIFQAILVLPTKF